MNMNKHPALPLTIFIVTGILLSFNPCYCYGQAEEVKLFRLSQFSGALTFSYQLTDEEESRLQQMVRDINRGYLEGGIQVNTQGSIYHSNLLTFRVNANILGHRTRNLLFSDSSVNNAINNTYNIHLSFLKKKKWNLQLYALRNFSTSDRAFHDRFFNTFRSMGATLVSREKFLPFRLEIYSNRVKSESLSYFERDERIRHLDMEVHLWEKGNTRSFVTFKSKDYSETTFNIDYKAFDLTANFNHYYGIKNMNQVSSVFSFHKMTGANDLENFQFYNNAVYYLWRNFNANASYILSKDNSFGRSYTKHDVRGMLRHKLYDSLISIAEAGGRFENSNTQEIDTRYYKFSLNYTKRIPTGAVQLSVLAGKDDGKYRSRDGVVNTSETFDFSLTDAIILTRQGIDPSSIRVTSEDLAILYVPGVDYQANILEGAITITRLPGGAILPESKVLVHYLYLSYPDFNLETDIFQFNARLIFLKYFQVFYRKSSHRQNIMSDYVIPPYEDFDKETMGGRFVSRFLRTEYYREHYDSTLSDYISRNFRASASLGLFRFLRLTGNVTINRLKYVPETFFSHLDAYSAGCSLIPGKNLSADAFYRNISYSTPSFTRNRESIILKARLAIRKIILELFYEHILTGYEATQRTHGYFSLMLRRNF
ncbi:MAG: hypothetical protein GY940_34880 [bacterium]|nr:hypothetical protein [bacterium]